MPKNDVSQGFGNMTKALMRLYAGGNKFAAICDLLSGAAPFSCNTDVAIA